MRYIVIFSLLQKFIIPFSTSNMLLRSGKRKCENDKVEPKKKRRRLESDSESAKSVALPPALSPFGDSKQTGVTDKPDGTETTSAWIDENPVYMAVFRRYTEQARGQLLRLLHDVGVPDNNVTVLSSHRPLLIHVKGAISPADCDTIIREALATNSEESGLSGTDNKTIIAPSIRKSRNHEYIAWPVANLMEKLQSVLVGPTFSHSTIAYPSGGHVDWHHDVLTVNNFSNRTWTFLQYLTDASEPNDGPTSFAYCNDESKQQHIVPKKGDAVIFLNSMFLPGYPTNYYLADTRSMHAGQAVKTNKVVHQVFVCAKTGDAKWKHPTTQTQDTSIPNITLAQLLSPLGVSVSAETQTAFSKASSDSDRLAILRKLF